MIWSFYSETNGRFLSRHLTSTSHESVKLSTPAGYRAIEGHFDHLSKRVDLATGEVIDDDTLAAERIEQQQRDRALSAIAELERLQSRPLRELVLDPSNVAAQRRLKEIDSAIGAERAKLSRGA